MGHKFNIDDEVKVSRATYSERYHKRGTVQEIDGTYRCPYYVEFDDGTGGWFAEEALTMVVADPNPEPTLDQKLPEEALNTQYPDDVKGQSMCEFLDDSQNYNAPTSEELKNKMNISRFVSMAFSLGLDPATEPEHYKARKQ